MNKKSNLDYKIIAQNKKARHDYECEQSLESGIVLTGWEVKSIRQGRVQIKDSYIIIKNSEAWLIGCNINPLASASTHVNTEPERTRKLMLKRKELDRLIGYVQRKGYTIVPLQMYWKKHLIKLQIALAKGRQTHDKRQHLKDKEWQRTQQRIMRIKNR